MNTDNHLEIEVKIKVSTIEALRNQLIEQNFSLVQPRFFETNVIYDTPRLSLKRKKKLLRLRQCNGIVIMTFKRPVKKAAGHKQYKVKEEIEITLSDFEKAQTIVMELGYEPVFIYEKYREIFQKDRVTVMIDETPIGCYMEIEGEGPDIDQTAASLGYGSGDYITDNYWKLFLKANGTGNMQFQ